MPKDTELEMREEYSFAGGVRGRYASRFTLHEREELIRQSARQDLQTWIAHSLLQLQSLEVALVVYLELAWGESPEQASRKAATLLDGAGTQTLRRLLADWSASGWPVAELRARFQHVRQERNWLIHRGSVQAQAAAERVTQATRFVRRLQDLAAEANRLESDLTRMLETRLASAGLSAMEIEQRADEVRSQWLAA